MEKVYNKIVDGEIVNSIVANANFIATQEGTWRFRVNAPVVLPTVEQEARIWRNNELKATDYIVPIVDHPSHEATLAYRVLLRDWTLTEDFPATKPTI